jgi:IclR family transcriptional regulator, acetate operon repressor
MTIQSIHRALDILEFVERSKGPVPLVDIAKATSLHVSTCHHLLKTLKDRGYVRQLKSHGAYLPKEAKA